MPGDAKDLPSEPLRSMKEVKDVIDEIVLRVNREGAALPDRQGQHVGGVFIIKTAPRSFPGEACYWVSTPAGALIVSESDVQSAKVNVDGKNLDAVRAARWKLYGEVLDALRASQVLEDLASVPSQPRKDEPRHS